MPRPRADLRLQIPQGGDRQLAKFLTNVRAGLLGLQLTGENEAGPIQFRI